MTEIKDLRKSKLYLNPETSLQFGWIPEGVEKQTIMNITDEGEPVGELEIGSDGFIKVVLNLDGKRILATVELIPGRNHAIVKWK